MVVKDNIHFTGKHMFSYYATWNAVWSTRETGKTTLWSNYAYKRWKKEHCTTIILRYLIADITDTYLSDLETSVNDFLPDDKQIKFAFKKGSIKDGVVDVFIKDYEDQVPIFRCIAISNPISRIKSMKLKNAGMIIFDEFILNVRAGEKYPESLVVRFKEIYNTYLRCCKTGKKFQVFMFGNPYSKYHPLLAEWGVPFGSLKEGMYYYNRDTDVYVEAYKMKPELRELIKKRNPLYKFDSTYTDYAFNGESINDTNFEIVEKQPESYSLKYIFRLNNKYTYIYQCTKSRKTIGMDTGRYWIDCGEKYTGTRNIFAVDLNNLIQGTQLITTDIRAIFWRLKNSIANRDVTYSSIEAGYLIEALYSYI